MATGCFLSWLFLDTKSNFDSNDRRQSQHESKRTCTQTHSRSIAFFLSFLSRNGTGILSELNSVQKLSHATTDTCNIFDRFAVIRMDCVNVIESTTEKLCQMNETHKKDQHIHSKKWARADIRRHQKS